MLFWPVLSTWMMAWPVLPADSSTNRVWTPARSSVSFRKCPSGPMRPACQVSTPARARATDWFSPLPPHWIDRVSGATGHHHFYDLPDYLNPGDCLILNNSRVLPARLVGQRLPGGGICEVLLLNDRGDKVWECLVRPGRKLRKGTRLSFGNGELTAEIVEQLEEGGRLIDLHLEN